MQRNKLKLANILKRLAISNANYSNFPIHDNNCINNRQILILLWVSVLFIKSMFFSANVNLLRGWSDFCWEGSSSSFFCRVWIHPCIPLFNLGLCLWILRVLHVWRRELGGQHITLPRNALDLVFVTRNLWRVFWWFERVGREHKLNLVAVTTYISKAQFLPRKTKCTFAKFRINLFCQFTCSNEKRVSLTLNRNRFPRSMLYRLL